MNMLMIKQSFRTIWGIYDPFNLIQSSILFSRWREYILFHLNTRIHIPERKIFFHRSSFWGTLSKKKKLLTLSKAISLFTQEDDAPKSARIKGPAEIST